MQSVTWSVCTPSAGVLSVQRAGTLYRLADTVAPPILRALLDEVDYPLVVSDADGIVALRNHAAHAFNGALVVDGNRLTATAPADQRRLREALHAAVTQARRSLLLLGQVPAQRCVAVIPVEAEDGGLALVLGERDRVCEELSLHSFARALGITDAETRVLAALARGESPASIAAAQKVAMSTVRTQIQALRMKLGSDTIRGLVARLARLPPLLSALRQAAAS